MSSRRMLLQRAASRLLLAAARPLCASELFEGGAAWVAEPVDERQDVIVIGSGLAGLSAGAAALESGARRVLVLEKGPLVGGHSLYSSGSIAAVAPGRAGTFPDGRRDSVEQFVADALAVGGGRGDPEVLVRIARGSGAALDWLERLGVSFGRPYEARSGLRPRSWSMPGNSAGRSYVLAVMGRLRHLGGRTLLSAAVETLDRRDGAWEAAARIREGGEEYVRRFLAPAVVIASGGFTANVAERRKILPQLTADIRTSANPYGTVWDGADGDGLVLAQMAGGGVVRGFGLQLLPFWGGRLIDYAGGDLYVDATGRRFVDENRPWSAVAEAIFALPGRRCWVITDAQSFKGATLGLKLINGVVKKAASVADLAAAMGVEKRTLEETLAHYNRAADGGFDPLTGKTVFTQRIEKPPFYFGEERIYVHTTLDGVRTDAEARVLCETGGVVPGLFVAGEAAGGIFGIDRLGGAGMANCLVMGRVAGEGAARRALSLQR